MKSAALWTIPLCAMVALPMNAQNNKQNNKGKQREKQEVVAKSGEGSDTNLGKANNMMMTTRTMNTHTKDEQQVAMTTMLKKCAKRK